MYHMSKVYRVDKDLKDIKLIDELAGYGYELMHTKQLTLMLIFWMLFVKN